MKKKLESYVLTIDGYHHHAILTWLSNHDLKLCETIENVDMMNASRYVICDNMQIDFNIDGTYLKLTHDYTFFNKSTAAIFKLFFG